MNLENSRKTIIKSAKAKLENHKILGRHSNLSLMQVAELWDIVSGNVEAQSFKSNAMLGGNFFSLN